ncbi:HCN2, partial [Symbiodinium sp. CCMP2456]
ALGQTGRASGDLPQALRGLLAAVPNPHRRQLREETLLPAGSHRQGRWHRQQNVHHEPWQRNGQGVQAVRHADPGWVTLWLQHALLRQGAVHHVHHYRHHARDRARSM